MAKKKGKKNDNESEEEYTVEKVVDKRIRNGKVIFSPVHIHIPLYSYY